MPEKKYVAYYRTIELGGNKYAHVAYLNSLGREKFGRKTFMDKIHIKGSKKTISVNQMHKKRMRI